MHPCGPTQNNDPSNNTQNVKTKHRYWLPFSSDYKSARIGAI